MTDVDRDSKESSGQAFSSREERETREALRYGIDLREIDEDALTQGETDVLGVFRADLLNRDIEPAPLIVGLMHMIQQKHGDASVTEVTEFSY